jgi:thiol-disulfide isomerase/thioredoxin
MTTINEHNFASLITKNIDDAIENKPIVIFCWASWQEKCNALWSVMDKMSHKYGDGIEFAHMDLSDMSNMSKEYRDIVHGLDISEVPLIIVIDNVQTIGQRVIKRTSEYKDVEKVVRLLIYEKLDKMTGTSISLTNFSQKKRIEYDMKILTLRSLLK